MEIKHKPVLLNEVLAYLDLKPALKIFDGTLGSGGYSEKILEKIGQDGVLIATDLDSNSIEISRKRIGEKENFKIFQKNYSEIKEILSELKIENIDRAVLDLGWSSDQFALSGRGLSFQNLDEDLDMNLTNLNEKKKLTAYEILNFWKEESIADIIFYYGEEKGARLIAKKIVEFREKKEIKKVADLVGIVEEAIGKFYKKKKIHSATKTFQALRIAVNNELENLKLSLKNIIDVLAPNGILVVVSFHSLEDRVVKKIFKEMEDEGLVKRLNKKVIKPSYEEVKNNPASRSAKMRVIKKII